jgi:GH15 family glucan-1,4-alpha-glucosidase
MSFLESHWVDPDNGVWEARGPRRHFTHSKVMAWLALDRSVNDAQFLGLEAPVDRWRALREELRREVLERAWSERRGAFVQAYDRDVLDASVLVIPLVGFLPLDDPRVTSTVETIRRELCVDGVVRRYETTEDVDGLPPVESGSLPCSFWLVDCLALLRREREATRLFERLLDVRNDLGLLSEEYDPVRGQMVGNYPHARSHAGLLLSADLLTRESFQLTVLAEDFCGWAA